MARLEINLPGQIYERLENESRYSGEPMDSIIARALMMYFSQPNPDGYGDNPLIIFEEDKR